MLALGLVWGCASTAQHDQLEAAVARFEQAAARAEAAAAAADASAQQAAAAAARITALAAAPEAPHLHLAGSEAYQRCAVAGRGSVRDSAQAAARAQAFLHCLGLAWGAATETRYVARDPAAESFYSVAYGVDPGTDGGQRVVLVGARDGRAEFPPPR